MELILALIGAVTGCLAAVYSYTAIERSKIEAVNAYYKNDRDPDFIEARRTVYNLPENYIPSDLIQDERGSKIAILILSYEQSGILVKEDQLPFWVFSKNAAGFAVVNFYRILAPYIEYRRGKHPFFAINFESLRNRIVKESPEILDYMKS